MMMMLNANAINNDDVMMKLMVRWQTIIVI